MIAGLTTAAGAFSAACSLAYWLWFGVRRALAPSGRSPAAAAAAALLKGAAVASLAVAARRRSPWLVLPLACHAAGDVLLAFGGAGPPGFATLAAFAAGHALYARHWRGTGVARVLASAAGVAVAGLASPALGMTAYTAVLLRAAFVAPCGLPRRAAVLFVAGDALVAIETVAAAAADLTWLSWPCYYAAQLIVVRAHSRVSGQ